MLDGLLGRSNFKTKCKSALTRTKTRLEVIKKKRNAMQRFLKKDIVDLLKNNLDRNAYGRAEGLYIELNLSSCYDYVEECCACISEHLKEMHKQSECVEECKVAAASLIYAAARFADLPELRDLRNQFNEKYGKNLDAYVSKEFVEKLKSHPPTMEMKLRLMEDIAKEISVAWDSKALEQQLQSSSDHNANLKSSNAAGDDQMLPRSRSDVVQLTKHQHRNSDKQKAVAGIGMRHSQSYSKLSDEAKEKHNMQEPRIPLSSSTSDTEDNANRKPFINKIVPAPYTITSKSDKHGDGTEDEDFSVKNKDKQNQNLEMEKNGDGGSVGRARPRPRSVRTKYLNQSHSTMSGSGHETDVNETMSARVPGQMSYGLKIGEKEKEVVTNDEFSTHFSRKKSPRTPINSGSAFQNGQPMSELPLPPGRRRYLFPESQPASPLKEVDGNSKCELALPSSKSKSLPLDQDEPELLQFRHAKTTSLQEDAFGHLHPKLPDFDELAERIAALKKV